MAKFMLQNFQIALLFHQQGVKRKGLVWQRRILLAGIAALCSVLIDLFMPMQASTQQRVSLTLTPIFHQSSLAVPRRFQGEMIRKVKLSSGSKAIALTFDDGPSPNTTPQILAILKEKNIKATFFLIGQNLKNFPQIGQQLVANGHALGNHTWHHWHRQVSEWTIASEIEDTAALIYETTGVKTSLFRPPNGFLYNGLANTANSSN